MQSDQLLTARPTINVVGRLKSMLSMMCWISQDGEAAGSSAADQSGHVNRNVNRSIAMLETS